jgi:hypothetical protein
MYRIAHTELQQHIPGTAVPDGMDALWWRNGSADQMQCILNPVNYNRPIADRIRNLKPTGSGTRDDQALDAGPIFWTGKNL